MKNSRNPNGYEYLRTSLVGALLGAAVLAASSPALSAEPNDPPPWWPSEWGAEDQAGASNRITPEKILEAIQLVTDGKVYEIGQPYRAEMPFVAKRNYSLITTVYGPFGDHRSVAHDDFLATQIGQVGTQLDGLAHVGRRITMPNGQLEDVFYNGHTADSMRTVNRGVGSLGVENFKPFITRGILIDIAGLKGVPVLDHSYLVTLDDVLAALWQGSQVAMENLVESDPMAAKVYESYRKFYKGARNYHHIARALDMGAEGLMLPMVGSAEEAKEIVAHAKYPPQGHRGVALQVAHDQYKPGPVIKKLRDANKKTTVFTQIETRSGVKNADAIAAVKGVDCLWVGHFDLSASLGIAGQFDHPDFLAAVKTVQKACAKHNKAFGRLVPDVKSGIAIYKAGFDFICYSGDVWVLQSAMADGIGAIRKGCKGRR